MKRWTSSLLFLSLISSLPASGADESCQIREILSQLQAESDVLITEESYQPNPQLLLYRLPAELADGSVLEVGLERRGATIFTEEITLLADSTEGSPSSVIELLSTSPAERARIHLLPADSVKVQIRLEGRELQSLSLEELIEGSDALKEEGVLPRAIQPGSSVVPAGSGFQSLVAPLTACEEDCWDDFDICTGNCSYPSGPGCYPACDSALISCLNVCNPSCAPKVKTKTKVAVVSISAIGPVQCNQLAGGGTDWYIWTQVNLKKTVTTTTTHEDCSQTVDVTVSYFDGFCWKYYVPDCSIPTSTITSTCSDIGV